MRILSVFTVVLAIQSSSPSHDSGETSKSKDFMSQLESLKSMLEQSVSLNNQRTKELHTEQNSMRQKLNAQALKTRRMNDDENAETIGGAKHEILDAINAATSELESRIDELHEAVEDRKRTSIARKGRRRLKDFQADKDLFEEAEEAEEAEEEEEEEAEEAKEDIKRDSFKRENGWRSTRSPGDWMNGGHRSPGDWMNGGHVTGTPPSYGYRTYPDYRNQRTEDPTESSNYGPQTTPDYTRGYYDSNWGQTTRGYYDSNWGPTTASGYYDSNESRLELRLEREIRKREKLKRRVKNLEEQIEEESLSQRTALKRQLNRTAELNDELFDLRIAIWEMKAQLNRTAGAGSHHEYRPSPPPPPPPHVHCESGVKSSGQLESHEISSQHVNFTRPFLNTPHIILAASMAAKYRTENGTQQPDGPVDFHLRKRHVTPQDFTIEFETSADEDAFIFATWMACGKSF